MKKFLIFGIIIFLVILLIISQKKLQKKEVLPTMNINSLAFKNGEFVPFKYTCDGVDVNPPLTISETPEGTKSLVLIVDDPDSPSGIFIHWLVWNIDPNTKEIKENSVPGGAVEGITSWGKLGYRGPCPFFGTHRYYFKVFALDEKLNLSEKATVKEVLKAMENHILGKGETMGKYIKK